MSADELAALGLVVCPTCRVACLWEGSRIANPPVVMERTYCPKCGWNPEVDK